LAEQVTAFEGLLGATHEMLGSWPEQPGVRAALVHSLEFETWRSLVPRRGLTGAAAVDPMLQFVRCCCG
jgi:hypothetical protein